MAYTLRDLHRSGAVLDYPIGGSKAVVDALIRGVNRGSEEDRVMLNAHIDRIIVEDGKAVGVQLRKGTRIRARKAVVSNASGKVGRALGAWGTRMGLTLLACPFTPSLPPHTQSGTLSNSYHRTALVKMLRIVYNLRP